MFPHVALALALAAGAPAAAGPLPGAGQGEIVEEVVAVVRNPPSAPARVITYTKLVEEARIALVSRGATDAASSVLDRPALRAALDWLLDQTVVADEAAKLGLDDVDRTALRGELRRFQERFPTRAAYDRFLEVAELSEDELAATLARMLRVERYVQSRVGRAAQVEDEEVDRFLRERGAAPGSPAIRDAARNEIAAGRATQQVHDLLAELRGRADIRIVGRLAAKDGA